MDLSKRLESVSNMLSNGKIVADIGTDHGYIPIHLIQTEKCKKVFAMDVNKGPYEKAKLHIAGYGLSDQITTRLSNGMKELNDGEVNAIIIAGMGGGLVIKILDQDRRLWSQIDEFVLQPQSEIHKVRKFIQENGFIITDEDMVLEDGKYYPIMKVIKGNDRELSESELYYGRLLIKEKNTVLKDFLDKEVTLKEQIINKLEEQILSVNTATSIDQVESDYSDSKVESLKIRIREIKLELEIAYEVQRNL